MRYKDWSIYQLYNRKSDSVVISESVNFNEDLLTNEIIDYYYYSSIEMYAI